MIDQSTTDQIVTLENKKKTVLLPPLSAVQLLWGTTRIFARVQKSDGSTQEDPKKQTGIGDLCATKIENEINELLKALKKPGKNETDPKKTKGPHKNDDSTENELVATENELVATEKSYLMKAKFILFAALRNAGIIYKGRQLSYEENKKLRKAYVDSLEKEYDIKGILKDAIKQIPGVGGGGATGVLLASTLFSDPGIAEYLLFVVLFGFIGYVFQFIFSRFTLYYKHQNYIRQDNEMTAYYIQYLKRMRELLCSLVDELEYIHKKCFGSNYYDQDEVQNIKDSVTNLVEKNNMPTRCKHIDAHIREGLVTDKNWYICEVGGELAERCEHFNKPGN